MIIKIIYSLVFPLMMFLIWSCDPLLNSDDIHVDPLASFIGTTQIENDSLIPPSKLQIFDNPKVTVVWQYITGPLNQYALSDESTVEVEPPYNFNGILMKPLPKDIVEASDPVIGSVWLYNDANNNGVFDDLYPPEQDSLNEELRSRQIQFETKFENFINNVKVEERQDVHETFLLKDDGQVYQIVQGREKFYVNADTHKLISGKLDLLTRFLDYRMDILGAVNKWERFFKKRHQDFQEFRYEIEVVNNQTKIDLYYKRRLFEKNSGEIDFENESLALVEEIMSFVTFAEGVYIQSIMEDWVNYPFKAEEDKDWAIGRTLGHHFIYFNSQKDLDEAITAEGTSAFHFSGISNLKLGYNLVKCSNQYQCEVLDWGDSIIVQLGNDFNYFQPPSSSSQPPVEKPVEISTMEIDTSINGLYEISTLSYISFLTDQSGKYWVIEDFDFLHKLILVGEDVWYSQFTNDQFLFVRNDSGFVDKVLIFKNQKGSAKKGSAVKLSRDIRADYINSADSLENRELLKADSTGLTPYLGCYEADGINVSLGLSVSGTIEYENKMGQKLELFQEKSQYGFPNSNISIKFSELDSIHYLTTYGGKSIQYKKIDTCS